MTRRRDGGTRNRGTRGTRGKPGPPGQERGRAKDNHGRASERKRGGDTGAIKGGGRERREEDSPGIAPSRRNFGLNPNKPRGEREKGGKKEGKHGGISPLLRGTGGRLGAAGRLGPGGAAGGHGR